MPAHPRLAAFVFSAVSLLSCCAQIARAELLAGAAKRDVTDRQSGPVNDPLYVKALVIKSADTQIVLITVDAVALGQIGPIPDDYLPKLRRRLKQEWNIAPEQIVVNASHCHGRVVANLEIPTVEAVADAIKNLQPVKLGVGVGHEDGIMENRRLLLRSGRTADVRHAYALPSDDEVVGTGPIDSSIGVVRFNRFDGSTLAVIYNFACHPIQGVPGGANTADLVGYASKAIEENTGPGSLALFIQGCGGDVNPINYKDVDHPRSAEPLGNRLGLSTLRAVHQIQCRDDDRLALRHETLELPRGDRTQRIAELQQQQRQLVASLQGTSLNLKTFMALATKYKLGDEFPSYYSHRYLHDDKLGKQDLRHLDAENRRNMLQYINNIQTMEELTRVQTNLALLNKHQASLVAAGKRTVEVEVNALRIGDMTLVTFPGELTVQIGLNIKQHSPNPQTFVAGYTNGYIYYAPTTEQLLNPGSAQEDCDSILAPEWQPIFENKVKSMLLGL